MKNLTIAISLRVLIIITFSLHVSSIFNYDSPTSLSSSSSSSRLYFTLSFWIVLGLIHFQQYKHRKNSPDGRFIMKEMILPEFNSNDETGSSNNWKSGKKCSFSHTYFHSFRPSDNGFNPDLRGEIPDFVDFIDCFIHPDCRFDYLLLFLSPSLFAMNS